MELVWRAFLNVWLWFPPYDFELKCKNHRTELGQNFGWENGHRIEGIMKATELNWGNVPILCGAQCIYNVPLDCAILDGPAHFCGLLLLGNGKSRGMGKGREWRRISIFTDGWEWERWECTLMDDLMATIFSYKLASG